MTRQLRDNKGKTGLVLANGGWVTYQHVVCLSRSPRSDGLPYPDDTPLPKYVTDVHVPKIAEVVEGDAIIEVSSSPRYLSDVAYATYRRTPSIIIEMANQSEVTLWGD